MKILSEITGKEYTSVDECLEAEAKWQKEMEELKAERERKANERKARAKEVEDASKKYYELLNSFIEDYGSYHSTIKDIKFPSIFDFFRF